MIPGDIPVIPYLRVVNSGNVVEQADTVADLAGTYCRMADELAAMVETEAKRSAGTFALLAGALGELHTALDELAAQALRGEL